MERLEAAGYRAVRDFERRAPGAPLAPQPEVLDRWGMARVRLRRPLDAEGVRWKNVAGTGEYIERVLARAPTAVEVRRLSEAERLGDALFTGLRLSEGVDLAALHDRYGVDVWQRYQRDLEPFTLGGLLRLDGSRLRLTRRGMLLAHEIMMVFV